jgi:hypothetical protein
VIRQQCVAEATQHAGDDYGFLILLLELFLVAELASVRKMNLGDCLHERSVGDLNESGILDL